MLFTHEKRVAREKLGKIIAKKLEVLAFS